MKKFPTLSLMIVWILPSLLLGQNDVLNRPEVGCTAELSPLQESTTFCSMCNFWPNGLIQYSFDSNTSSYMQAQVLQAFVTLESFAGLTFVPHSGSGPRIKFIDSDGNNSPVGISGGTNNINIYNWNNQQIIIHEILHSLGFWHEQSRPDRNDYISYNSANVCSGFSHNFDIESTGVTSNIPYDFESIMHYGPFAFSRCSDGTDCSDGCGFGNYVGPTIEVLPAYSQYQSVIGQTAYLSRSDSLLIAFIYPFSDYRFVNGYISNSGDAQFLYTASDDFSKSFIDSPSIDPDNTIWIMPDSYENAEGLYTKPCTIKAPFGGVILR